MLELRKVRNEADFDAVRTLSWSYRDLLISLGGRNAEVVKVAYPEPLYTKLMEELPIYHAPPEGEIVSALLDGSPIGCGMVHTLSPGVAEIKRVYVSETARGLGAGRRIMVMLLEICRERGFDRIVMDTGRVLTAAQTLYRDLGFVETGPYQDMPAIAEGIMVFYEMRLT